MKTGIYRDMPAGSYHTEDGLSYSRAKDILKCPARCKFFLDNPRKATRPQVFGSAVHCRVLFGEDALRASYGLKLSWATKEGKAQREACGGDDEFLLTEEELQRVEACAASLAENETLKKLLAKVDDRELSLFWIDRERNVQCKARLDGYFPGTIIDLKTVGAADPFSVLTQLRKHSYHMQAAHYIDGARVCGLKADVFCLLCVEALPPHHCAAYVLDERTIGAGRLMIADAVAKYGYCMTTGDWPSYPPISDLGLFPNDLNKIEESYGKGLEDLDGGDGADELE